MFINWKNPKRVGTWLKTFLDTDFESFTLDCELKYFNSSTAKLLLNILIEMDEHAENKKVRVNWIAAADNDIIIECGEALQKEMEQQETDLVVN